MARRLNQEAAKAVKYGGVSEVEALKFVTLNPAKLLHIDHRVGSIAVGKDADVVLWTDHPLSVYAQVDLSFIDGICYYSAAEDVELRETMAEERARILWKMKQAGDDGPPGAKPRKPMERIPPHYHCDTLTDENR
jgi:adenine deaminase